MSGLMVASQPASQSAN